MATEIPPDILEQAKRSSLRLGQIEQLVAELTDVDKLELISRVARSVQFKRDHDAEIARVQRKNMLNLIEELENAPPDSGEPGFALSEHDQAVYGLNR